MKHGSSARRDKCVMILRYVKELLRPYKTHPRDVRFVKTTHPVRKATEYTLKLFNGIEVRIAFFANRDYDFRHELADDIWFAVFAANPRTAVSACTIDTVKTITEIQWVIRERLAYARLIPDATVDQKDHPAFFITAKDAFDRLCFKPKSDSLLLVQEIH
jgi:hypothetical protein